MVYTPSELEITATPDHNNSQFGTLELITRTMQPSGGYEIDYSLQEEPSGGGFWGYLKITYKGATRTNSFAVDMPMPAHSSIPYELSDLVPAQIIQNGKLFFHKNATYALTVLNDDENSFERDEYTLTATDDDLIIEPAITLA